MSKVIAVLVGLAVIVGVGEALGAEPLIVGAPPSLRAAFDEVVALFQQEYRAPVSIVYTPSKALLKHIEQGAAIDVFVAAGMQEVEQLHAKGLTLNGAGRMLAQTSLVLVMSADSPATLVSFPDALANRATRIALGDPEMSYLGEVTVRALTKISPMYKSRTHVLYAPHTEDIVHLIRTGKADVGVVYRANVINHGDVRISDENPFGAEVQIQFGQAVVSTCRASVRAVADQFSDFLMTPRVVKLLEKYGFDPPSWPMGRATGSNASLPASPR
jgi:molybdate transport system substrate-binding protein